MKVLNRFLWMLMCGVLLCSCEIPVDQPLDKTLILYMAAENSLSDYALKDLNEIEQVAGLVPKNCHVVAYVDRAGLPASVYTFSHKEGKKLVYTYPEPINSCDSTQMRNILHRIVNEYPAREYALALWSHGSGWLPNLSSTNPAAAPQRVVSSFGIDNQENSSTSNRGSQLSLQGLASVLSSLPAMSWVFFDACFMQSVEVAYELRQHTNYVIGSPAEIPGDGAPYDKLIPIALKADWSDFESIKKIPVAYYEHYENADGLVISVVDTKALPALASAWKECLAAYGEDNALPNLSAAQHYTTYVAFSNSGRPDFYDMQSVARLLHSDDDGRYAHMEGYLNWAIPYHAATKTWTTAYDYSIHQMIDAAHSCCASMFFPQSEYLYSSTYEAQLAYYRTLQWYKASGLDKLF